MQKTILFFFLAVVIAVCASETKAQQAQQRIPEAVTQKIIKALETKIADLEVQRAMDLPFYHSESTHIKVIDAQLNNLRIRMAELTGYSVSAKTIEAKFPPAQEDKMKKMIQWTDGEKRILY